jgi:signal transduction histidine kinase
VFVSLAFLAFYRDWRLFVTATSVVFVDHLARGTFWPESIYGVPNPEWWSFLEHVAWVAFEDGVLILGCNRAVADMKIVADREAALEVVSNHLQNVQAELAHVMRASALGELAASIAHEVRQPLAAISADAAAALNWLGLRPPDIERASEAMTAIDSDCQRASDVLSRITALLKRAPFQRTTCDLNSIVSQVVPLVRPQLESKGVVLETELEQKPLRILGDSVQLQQVLINLLLNAADACQSLEARPRLVVVRTTTERRDGESWSVASVADTGKGIRPELRARIFEAFYTTKSDGLGMGLSISRTIVLRHDGELSVSPNLPSGATFAVRLPLLP